MRRIPGQLVFSRTVVDIKMADMTTPTNHVVVLNFYLGIDKSVSWTVLNGFQQHALLRYAQNAADTCSQGYTLKGHISPKYCKS